MSDPTYPCPVCNRYSCRCSESSVRGAPELPEQRQPPDWTPWWRAFASNA